MYERGFTLMELFCVLVLTAIVLMFAIPSYGPSYQKQHAKSIALTLLNCYQYSRMQARLLSEPLVLLPMEGKGNFDEGARLVRFRDLDKPSQPDKTIQQWTWNTHQQISIKWHGVRSQYPLISPRLNEAMMNGHFDLKGKYAYEKVIVNRFGRARVK